VLSTAIHSLLGLDLVDQTTTDLLVLERRKRTEQKSHVEREELARIDQEIERLQARKTELVQERAAAQNDLDKATKRLREAGERYQRAGGEAFEKRKELESKREARDERLRVVEDELRDIAAQAAPLMLVPDLLDMVVADAEAEKTSIQAQGIVDLLADRDAKLLDTARRAGASEKVLSALHDFLAADLERHTRIKHEGHYLELSTEGHAMLAAVMLSLGDEAKTRISQRIAQAERLQLEIVELERRLQRAPAQDAIAKLAAERSEAQAALDKAQRTLRDLDETAERVNRELVTYTRRKEDALKTTVEQERLTRMLARSEEMRQAFARFRGTVVQRNVSKLEELILDSFQQILRKKSLIAGLRIDPETFAMTLLGQDRRELSPERLSAGERQLLAISTIWGLARASGRPLPVVIDTPLGRLDSVHRKLLVERYFPNASLQVILLSTDEEIDEQLYEELKPFIGHTYRLDYDDRSGATTVVPGYFW
jgi:DNA sulfur modification protein DndD